MLLLLEDILPSGKVHGFGTHISGTAYTRGRCLYFSWLSMDGQILTSLFLLLSTSHVTHWFILAARRQQTRWRSAIHDTTTVCLVAQRCIFQGALLCRPDQRKPYLLQQAHSITHAIPIPIQCTGRLLSHKAPPIQNTDDLP